MGIDLTVFVKTRKKFTEAEINLLNYRYKEAGCLGKWLQEEKEGFTVLDLDSYSRCYDKGYERGNFIKIYMSLRWVRSNINDAEIYYGGDCSDKEYLSIMTIEDQEDLLKHWAKDGHRPYRSGFNDKIADRFCPNCKVDIPLTQFMWNGKEGGAFYCLACDFKEETKDAGKTWATLQQKIK